MQAVLALIIAVLVDWWAKHLPGGQFVLRCRSVTWVQSYTAKILGLVSNSGLKQSYLTVLALFVPLLLGLFIIRLVLVILLGASGNLLFVTLVLLYCLGDKEAVGTDSEYIRAHESSFAILFWFAILGPYGAMLYWFLSVIRNAVSVVQPSDTKLFDSLNWLHAIAAWLPIRITGILFALVGNFTAGFNCWLTNMRNPSMPSREFISECGNASVDASIANDSENLVDRAFIAWVILSILIVVVK